jgi:Tol biopolymer transport system component
VAPLKLPPAAYQHPRAAPKGSQIAFASDDGKDAIVWTYDLSVPAEQPKRLTFAGKNRFPIWSADGQRVAFQSDREGDLGIFWQPANGGTADRLTKAEPGTAHVPESWSPKGDRFLFAVIKGSNVSLWSYSLQDKKATPFADVQSPNRINATFSPDGRWVAYNVTEGAITGVYVQPFPATGAMYQISKTSTAHPAWSRDGRELITQPPGGVQWDVHVITTGTSVTASAPSPWPRGGTLVFGPAGQRNYDVVADGRILGVIPAAKAQAAESTTQQIRVVLNWFEELKRRVPVK